jgi:large subunit ribosomal protein L34
LWQALQTIGSKAQVRRDDEEANMSTKRTYQPKKGKRVKKHGFMARMATIGGQNVVKRRRAAGRERIAVTAK